MSKPLASRPSELTGQANYVPPPTSGRVKLLMIPTNFADDTTEPLSVDDISTMLSRTAAFYKENSYGALTVLPTVSPWVTLPTVSSNNWANNNAALAAVKTQTGIDPAAYDLRFVLLIFPGGGNNGLCAQGTQADAYAMFAQWCFSWQSVAHEMGHSFDAYHSHGEICSQGVLDDDNNGLASLCTIDDYGDLFDNMGAPAADPAGSFDAFHWNAFQKKKVGWLGGKAKIQTITASGTYSLGDYINPKGKVPTALFYQALEPVKHRQGYYIEYRPTIGILIHTGGGIVYGDSPLPDDSVLKDQDPTAVNKYVLAAGETYAGNQLSVTHIGNGTVTVTVP